MERLGKEEYQLLVNLDFLFQNGTSVYKCGDKGISQKTRRMQKMRAALFDGSTQRDRLRKGGLRFCICFWIYLEAYSV